MSFPFRLTLADLISVWNNNCSEALRHRWSEAVRPLTAPDGEVNNGRLTSLYRGKLSYYFCLRLTFRGNFITISQKS